MPSFKAFAIGTYFTTEGAKQATALNVKPMQILTWVAKANRPNSPTTGNVAHPLHSTRGYTFLGSAQDAYAYASDIYARLWPTVAREFGLAGPTLLVPVPSSNLDYAAAHARERFPSWEFAKALASRVKVADYPMFVWAEKHVSRTAGGAGRVEELFASLRLIRPAPSTPHRILFVDDMMTHGAHLAAMHSHIPSAVGALCISFAQMNDSPTPDACQPEFRHVTYHHGSALGRGWGVSTSLAERLSV